MLRGRRGRVKAGLEERGRGRRSGRRRGTWCAVVKMCWDCILRPSETQKASATYSVWQVLSPEGRYQIGALLSLYILHQGKSHVSLVLQITRNSTLLPIVCAGGLLISECLGITKLTRFQTSYDVGGQRVKSDVHGADV
jgi:hypothetical protein